MIHVDDMAIMSPLRDLVDKFTQQLAEKFEIEDNGLISLFLGLKVIRNRSAKMLELSQKTYVELIVKNSFVANQLIANRHHWTQIST